MTRVEVCDREHRGRALLSYPEAVAQLLAAAVPAPLPVERVALPEAAGRVLAEPIRLDRAEPPVPRSAMDGFALRSADGDAPRRLRGAIYAGTAQVPEVRAGEAVAVMTGGTVPPGADAVIPVELTRTDPDAGELHVEVAPEAGQHVRAAGEMGEAGRTIREPGVRLGVADLGAAAGCGADPLAVRARPRACVLSTGDEVVPWHEQPALHQVRDSNRLLSLLQLRRAGARAEHSERVRDEPASLRERVGAALEENELVVTIGGVSMGDKDHLPEVFSDLGVERLFHGVSIQPGKPVWAGARDGRWVLGLPGNPVSSFVILELLGVPLVERLSGVEPLTAPRPLERGLSAGRARAKRRERFLPADLRVDEEGNVVVAPRPERGSGDWTSLAGSSALLHLPPGASVEEGEPVSFVRVE